MKKMTLDEVIDSFTDDLKYSDVLRNVYARLYLEELRKLRVELERNSKELELYNKALELACDTIADRDCTDVIACSRNSCELYALCFNEIDGKEYFLQKVREQA